MRAADDGVNAAQPGAPSRPAIHVVAGVLFDAAGRVLLAQRPPGKHLAGGWEFPGGKLEAGEERLAGLARELREELGITVEAAEPLLRLTHAYPERDVDLDVWLVTRYGGEPRGLDGQALRWCAPRQLGEAGLLPADRPIVATLIGQTDTAGDRDGEFRQARPAIQCTPQGGDGPLEG